MAKIKRRDGQIRDLRRFPRKLRRIFMAPLEVFYIKWIRNKCLHSCGYNQVRVAAAALSAQLSSAERIKKNLNPKVSSRNRPQELNVSECSRERRGGREDVSAPSPAPSFFGQELPATRSALNYRWRMMLALFLSVMSCTCKLQNILESHRCPLISSLSLPPSAKSRVIHLQCSGGRPQGSAA